MEKNPILVLFDLGGEFEEGEDDSRGVRLGQGGMLQSVRPEGVLHDIGRTRQEEPQRVGQEAGGRRAVAVEVIFDRLDIVCAMATGALEVCVQHLGRRRLQRGHHTAGVIARLHDFGLEHDPPGLGPRPCGIAALVLEAAPGRWRLAMGLGPHHPLVMEPPRLLDGRRGVAEAAVTSACEVPSKMQSGR